MSAVRRRVGRRVAPLALAIALVGCGPSEGGTVVVGTPGRGAASAAPTAAPTVIPGGVSAFPVPARSPLDGPYPRFRDAASGLVTVLGTPDLAPGAQRVSFVLSDAEGLVRLPALAYEVFRFTSGPTGPSGPPVGRGVATFAPFPQDTRGLYTTRVEFSTPGTWGLRLQVPRANGAVDTTLFAFEVPADARAPLAGEAAPRSRSRTLADADLAQLSTGAKPDAALYQVTIADALAAARPLVVVFASPGFCTNALCGPQVEQLSELRAVFEGQASFIHVELYENPQAVRERGLEAGIRTPLFKEWGLETDEWTFVVDSTGTVAARFEGFAPREEVETALRATLAAAR